jgi:hypothetical protein
MTERPLRQYKTAETEKTVKQKKTEESIPERGDL